MKFSLYLTHTFNHSNIIKYCNRPFSCAEEMNEIMVDNWNSVVSEQDKVYHLGDVYMSGSFSRDYTSALLRRLKGKKRLILGNHDNGKDQLLQNNFQKIDVWRMFPEFGLLLTHVPVHESSLYRGAPGDKDRKKLQNIHGHIHEKSVIGKWDKPDPDYRCVCVEHLEYTPINIEELRKW